VNQRAWAATPAGYHARTAAATSTAVPGRLREVQSRPASGWTEGVGSGRTAMGNLRLARGAGRSAAVVPRRCHHLYHGRCHDSAGRGTETGRRFRSRCPFDICFGRGDRARRSRHRPPARPLDRLPLPATRCPLPAALLYARPP
jgi:hypothetical protein